MHSIRGKRVGRALAVGIVGLFAGYWLIVPGSVLASCGSAFCSVSTDWVMGNAAIDPGWRLDMRYEYVNQNRLQQGTSSYSLDPSSPNATDFEHIERQTVNQNLISTMDYQFNDNWGIAITLPIISRYHHHIGVEDDGMGGFEFHDETWNFTELGDIRAVGRYQWHVDTGDGLHSRAIGITFGLKLPTGRYDIKNSEGEAAERSLQPGTGTTDGIVGAFVRQAVGAQGTAFAQVTYQAAFAQARNFAPGDRAMMDVGYRFSPDQTWGLMVQVNATQKGRDMGAEGEPAESGATQVFLSPGISYSATRDFQVYGFYQYPLYQDVNGIQLVADQSYLVGITTRF